MPAVERVFVRAAGGLLFDDFAFLPARVLLHGKAADDRMLRQNNAKLAFDDPFGRVLKGQVQLGEGEGLGDDRIGLEADERKAAPVRRRQAERRLSPSAKGAQHRQHQRTGHRVTKSHVVSDSCSENSVPHVVGSVETSVFQGFFK